jgi:ribosome recycling factor
MIPKPLLTHFEGQMQKTIDKMRSDFSTLRTGRASAALVENIRVEYYGAMTPMNQVASVAAPEARVLEIRPWDKSALQSIEKAIQKSDLGLNPSNDGSIIRLQIPAMTEERRRDLTKVVRKMAEEYRVAIRNERRDAVERLKKAEKAKEISEDDRQSGELEIQKVTDQYVKKVDELLAAKERDITEI